MFFGWATKNCVPTETDSCAGRVRGRAPSWRGTGSLTRRTMTRTGPPPAGVPSRRPGCRPFPEATSRIRRTSCSRTPTARTSAQSAAPLRACCSADSFRNARGYGALLLARAPEGGWVRRLARRGTAARAAGRFVHVHNPRCRSCFGLNASGDQRRRAGCERYRRLTEWAQHKLGCRR